MSSSGISYGRSVIRCRSKIARYVLASIFGLLMPAVVWSQFVVEEGKGSTLCERVAKHLNRLTENGSAKRLWVRFDPKVGIVRYPRSQSYLTRELMSFPGFERPPFTEVRLQDLRGLLELMGEADALASHGELWRRYSGNRLAYATARRAEDVPGDLIRRFQPYGERSYQELEKGSARVFKLAANESLSNLAVLQIEYARPIKDEPVSMLREVSDDLTTFTSYSDLDRDSNGHFLVLWKGAYFSISHSTSSSLEIQSWT